MSVESTTASVHSTDRFAVLRALHRQRRRIPAGIAVIGVANRKGGVGKTTVAMNLAAALGLAGRRPIVVDADPQGSAVRWSEQRDKPDTLPVAPAKITSVSSFVAVVQAAAAGVDTVVVDLPPSLTKPSLVVCLVADLIFIPITASPLDLWAARAAIETVVDARNLRNGQRPLLTVIPSRIDDRTSRGRRLAGGLKAMGLDVGPTLHERVAFRDAVDRGNTVSDLDIHAPARREFARLATHALQRLDSIVGKGVSDDRLAGKVVATTPRAPDEQETRYAPPGPLDPGGAAGARRDHHPS